MSIEVFGAGGACKASGLLQISATAVDSACIAQGIRQMLWEGAGLVLLELVDPIGATELLALCQLANVTPGFVNVQYVDATHLRIRVANQAGEAAPGVVWFQFCRIPFPVVPVV